MLRQLVNAIVFMSKIEEQGCPDFFCGAASIFGQKSILCVILGEMDRYFRVLDASSRASSAQ